MKYINERILLELGIDWLGLISVIEEATWLIKTKEVNQPIKPYLRFNDPVNRIIAMPAFVGGAIDAAGLKWIASFPKNHAYALKRAHSVIVLNDTATGVPTTLINTALISGIRTASVTGFVLKRYFEVNKIKSLNCGIIGFGPIGQLHLQMLQSAFKDKFVNFFVYDLQEISKQIDQDGSQLPVTVCKSWEEVFEKCEVFITCTVASQRYVTGSPKKGGLYLNVSLRDFHVDFMREIDVNIVDSWEEVCRENTDIEKAHLQFGLKKDDVLEITDVLDNKKISGIENSSMMFSPMGMGIYDIAVAKYYQNIAVKENNFVALED